MLGDLNGWVGDRVRAGITGVFGVPKENDNGRRGVDFCHEGGCVWVHKSGKGPRQSGGRAHDRYGACKKDMLFWSLTPCCVV